MLDKQPLIAHTHPKSPISESYRVLRTNIQFAAIDKPIQVIVITSSNPGEGKSTTVANLAVTFVQSGCRTLVVDADLRKPTLHKILNVENRKGLTHVLSQHEDYRQLIQKYPGLDLDFLCCGVIPPNPSELLSSNAMRQFLDRLRQDYDIIILDSPPVGIVTDAAILSTLADGTILMAASGQVEIESIKRAMELLEKVNANIIGVVLNKLDKNARGNYYYDNQYYYSGENDSPKPRKHRKRRHSQENVSLV